MGIGSSVREPIPASKGYSGMTDDGLFGIANISPKRTGLPFVVWISPSFGAPHDVRVWVSKGLKARSSELAPVAIRPEVRVIVTNHP